MVEPQGSEPWLAKLLLSPHPHARVRSIDASDALGLPGVHDPQTPVGAKGVAEAAAGTGAAVVSCALANAMGDDYLRRTPVGVDMIIRSLEEKKRVDRGLTANV